MPYNYFPTFYQPQPMAQQPMQQQQQQQMQQVQQIPQQVQNGGFISVPNESVARNFPVALGNSVTFKDETAPYIYTKTMGFSQLETPKFEKYKLVKEEPAEPSNLTDKEGFDVKPINDTLDSLKSEIGAIWGEIEGIKNVIDKSDVPTPKKSAKRKEDGDD